MKSVLCTGCCGFIGSNCLRFFCEKYPEVNFINLDRLDYCSCKPDFIANENYNFVYGCITDSKLISYLLKKYKVDTIIHFAAQTHVDNSFGNSISFTKDNVIGTHTLLECVRNCEHEFEKFIHISTDEVYGEVDAEHGGCHEKYLLNPTNPYAATKAAAEFICKSYYSSFKIPIIIVRGNNVYGPGQYPEKVIPKFSYLLSNDKKCTIHGKGNTRRNFIHCDDIASAIDIIIEKGIINEIYNIGTRNEYSVMEIFKKLMQILKPDEKLDDWLEYVEDRNFNDFRYAIDSTKLTDLGWKESIDFETGFKTTVEWYVKTFKNSLNYWSIE